MSDAAGALPEFVIERVFDAPREVVWRAWAEPEVLAKWLGPRGTRTDMLQHCMQPGGVAHFRMTIRDRPSWYGRFVFQEVDAPRTLRWRHMFADAEGNPARNPWEDDWPLVLMTTVRFTEEGDKTRVRLSWVPVDAAPEELATFAGGMKTMKAGWSGSFETLDGLLPGMGDRDHKSTGALHIGKKGERQLEIVRRFAAPRVDVWRAFTEPALISKWMLGPGSAWTMPVCEVDLRPGGQSRYVWRSADGQEMGVTGTFVEVEAPGRMVHDEIFDEDWYDGPARIETVFEAVEGGTRVRMTITYRNPEARDRVFGTPMAQGMEAGYQRLDATLAARAAA